MWKVEIYYKGTHWSQNGVTGYTIARKVSDFPYISSLEELGDDLYERFLYGIFIEAKNGRYRYLRESDILEVYVFEELDENN